LRKTEFAERISGLTGKSVDASRQEVDKSVQRLFYWAAFADKVNVAFF
jgi:aldehyde dehydrogenase (NAD+)